MVINIMLCCMSENGKNEYSTIKNGHIPITTIVIGQSSENCFSDTSFLKAVVELKQILGMRAVFIERSNEYIFIMTDNDRYENSRMIRDINLWLISNRIDADKTGISIGIDKREAEEVASMNTSISIARYHMYKNMMEQLPYRLLSKSRMKTYISVFKEILNFIVDGDDKEKLNNEVLEISKYIDALIVGYSQKYPDY